VVTQSDRLDPSPGPSSIGSTPGADVTIVIPTRDRPDFLRACLHSVLASAAEAAVDRVTTRVLVVDDASATDETQRLCAELGVDCLRLDVHTGPADPAVAIVRGVSQVESTWYSLFGDDDIMLPRFIRAHVAALRAGADVCATSYRVTDAELRPVDEVILPEAALGDLLVGTVTVNDGAMTRTDLVRGLSWDPALEKQILFPIWLELLSSGARFTRLTEPTFLYRRHGANISSSRTRADLAWRLRIAEPFRERILARDGVLPSPTREPGRVTPARRPLWRRALGRIRKRLGG
jgi:glycosyltransferase involved in cell wall biosynthesis